MKLDDVIERVRADVPGPPLAHDDVRAIVERTLAAVGLHVANDGEVYNPAPAPSLVIPNVPAMNAARYGGPQEAAVMRLRRLRRDLVWSLVLAPYFFARVIWTLLFGRLGLFNDLLVAVRIKRRPSTGAATWRSR